MSKESQKSVMAAMVAMDATAVPVRYLAEDAPPEQPIAMDMPLISTWKLMSITF
jgi:hypothetical protein